MLNRDRRGGLGGKAGMSKGTGCSESGRWSGSEKAAWVEEGCFGLGSVDLGIKRL